jgi:hypothetical protein
VQRALDMVGVAQLNSQAATPSSTSITMTGSVLHQVKDRRRGDHSSAMVGHRTMAASSGDVVHAGRYVD